MAIVKPFIAGRRFVSTAATGTVAGADLTFANTDFTDDAGAVTTFPASYAFLTLYINGGIQKQVILLLELLLLLLLL